MGDYWLRRLRIANEEHTKAYSCMRNTPHNSNDMHSKHVGNIPRQIDHMHSKHVSNIQFVCVLLNGTSALFRPLMPRIVEVKHMRHVKNDL